MAALPNLDDLLAQGVSGRGVFVRADFNVPLNDEGQITDQGRITASVPTLSALAEAGAKVVATSHLGRPKGAPDPKYSLAPVAWKPLTSTRSCSELNVTARADVLRSTASTRM